MTQHSKYEAMIFRNDHGVVSVVGQWPKYTQMSIEMFGICNHGRLSVNDDGHVVIKVSNGEAVYKLDKEQCGVFSIQLELVRSAP